MGNKVLKYVGRTLLVILVTAVMLFGIAYAVVYKIANGPSQTGKEMFVTTILETGQLKFLASWVCSKEEIQEIVDKNNLKKMDVNIEENLININSNPNEPGNQGTGEDGKPEEFDANGIRIEEVVGRSFYGKMMIIKDPSQVGVGTSYNNGWTEYGKNLDELVSGAGGVAGVNGGLYVSAGNKGGQPQGVVVQNGQVTLNEPGSLTGLYLIGFNGKNHLVIKDMEGMSPSDLTAYIESEGIRDAVAFQEENSDANNHFVPLVINGQGRELNGQGSGANPRTAIGQRADGAILLLVTDGRGADGHFGATAADLIGVMLDYGAVNAANLDGGSSSSMVYNNNYEMTSVTFYYQNDSWKMPTAIVVKPKSN